MTIRLSELVSGQQGKVLSVLNEGSMRERLLDLGLTPGAAIQRLIASPTGDPICYRIRGAMIALRNGDADRVMVKV